MRLAFVLGLLPVSAALAQEAPDRAAILAAVDGFFAGMRARDTAAMADRIDPGSRVVAVRYRGDRAVVTRRLAAPGRARIAASPAGPHEWLLAAEVWQDGDLAAVWAPYEIHEDGRLLHCGYDAFGLVREADRWRIARSAFTIRPDGCPAIRAAAAGPLPLAPPSAPERRAVLAVVDSFFVAMRRRDTVLLGRSFAPEADWVVVGYREGRATIRRRPASQDAPMIAAAAEPLDERLLDATVRVDGDLAMVWAPYQFRIGSRLSHCGFDYFQLTREDGIWRLEGGAYTTRPEGCARMIGPRRVDSLPSRPADFTGPYGADRRQVGELRLPEGPGPFPVAVVIHGGCWLRRFASADNTAPLAEALRQAGIATWNVEYRTADEPGGGWPGTFHDVADATDHLRVLARSHPLDTTRVVAVGHSAGGHLAGWVAARHRVPPGSPLARPAPLRLLGAAALGPVLDLAEAGARIGGACGSGIPALVGGSAADAPERYRVAAPIGLLPLGVPLEIVVGELDGIFPAAPREDYVRRARLAGDLVRLAVVPGAGHFEPIAPGSNAWPATFEAVRRLLAR